MPSKSLQLTLAWILLASLIMGMAVWQVQVTVARDIARKHEMLPPPTNTRHAIRPAPTVPDIDPVADYIARCEKGMTIQEIRWILTDFENAGLATDKTSDEMTEAVAAAYHKARLQWYLGCLAQGLNLSREQQKEASDMMTSLARQAYDSHLKYLRNSEKAGEERPKDHTTTDEDINLTLLYLAKDFYFFDSEAFHSLLPWKLCKLTPPQASLTWKHWYDLVLVNRSSSHRIDAILEQPELSDPRKLSEKTGGPLFLAADTINTSTIGIPSWLDIANLIHPLLATQKVAGNSDDPDDLSKEMVPKRFIPQLRALHPVQLKMALLLAPDMPGKIRAALETSGF